MIFSTTNTTDICNKNELECDMVIGKKLRAFQKLHNFSLKNLENNYKTNEQLQSITLNPKEILMSSEPSALKELQPTK